ncbi:MAG TPA: hypothetical protein DC054_13980 [Blastocatellia bacterium]|nr:hypothetical protein [Blastocatellia bacterium]
MFRHLLLGFTLIFAGSMTVAAQPKQSTPAPAKVSTNEAPVEAEAERLLRERRANAQSLLISLATDARNFTDATVRARSQARIADMLWEADRERSRTMFRSAWDAAEVADAESQQRVQEDIRQQQARTGRGGFAIASPPNLRREVLEFAARHDSKLGEDLLARYKDQKAREAADERNRRSNPFGTDDATAQRFGAAKQIVEAGDIKRALEFADPALGSVNMDSVDFLSQLREKDPAAADQRYAAMILNAPLNPQADANTVSLLSSYLFSPHQYAVFMANGSSTSRMGGGGAPANVSPELRAAFFRMAADILLRPLGDQSTAGPDGQYLGLKRMMPLFEQFAPAELTAALKAQLEGLAAVASDTARNRDNQATDRLNQVLERATVDREQTLLDQAERAKTATERDQINLQLAQMMVDKDDRRARDYVDKIDDMELRDAARAFIDASIAWKLVNKRDADRALELAKNGELSHFQKAWLLSQTAAFVGVKDRGRALPVIEDAAAEARRIETSDPDRPRAFFAIANVVMNLNRAAVWEITSDAIKASNSADKFTGEDGQIVFRLISKGTNSVHQHSFADFDVAGIFTKLAAEDYDKAVQLARGFQGEAPRANAVIAIARSVLDEKKH